MVITKRRTDDYLDDDSEEDQELGCMNLGDRFDKEKRESMPVEESCTPGGFLEFDRSKEEEICYAPLGKKTNQANRVKGRKH